MQNFNYSGVCPDATAVNNYNDLFNNRTCFYEASAYDYEANSDLGSLFGGNDRTVT